LLFYEILEEVRILDLPTSNSSSLSTSFLWRFIWPLFFAVWASWK